MITCITPTGDRPKMLDTCAQWLAMQGQVGVQWIVVDDGVEPHKPDIPGPGWEVEYVRRFPGEAPSVLSFAHNIEAAIPLVKHEKVVMIEDDDYYAPAHLETVSALLDKYDAVGDERQHYYYLPDRIWCDLQNRGASLAQTAFRRNLLPLLKNACEWAIDRDCRGIDARFWGLVRRQEISHHLYTEPVTVVGLKGRVGRPGLGIGHRPEQSRALGWEQDPALVKLKEWMGESAWEVL
jgi:hypothetical protein